MSLFFNIQHFRYQSLVIVRFIIKNFCILPIKEVLKFQNVLSDNWMSWWFQPYVIDVFFNFSLDLSLCLPHIGSVAVIAEYFVDYIIFWHKISFIFLNFNETVQFIYSFETNNKIRFLNHWRCRFGNVMLWNNKVFFTVGINHRLNNYALVTKVWIQFFKSAVYLSKN